MLRFKVSDGVKLAHGSKVLEGGMSYEAEDSFVHGWASAGLVEVLTKQKSETGVVVKRETSAKKTTAKKTTAKKTTGRK